MVVLQRCRCSQTLSVCHAMRLHNDVPCVIVDGRFSAVLPLPLRRTECHRKAQWGKLLTEHVEVTFLTYTLSKQNASHDRAERTENVQCVDTIVPATSCTHHPPGTRVPQPTFYITLLAAHQTKFVKISGYIALKIVGNSQVWHCVARTIK